MNLQEAVKIVCLDMYAQGYDPTDDEPQAFAVCEQCGIEILSGDTYADYDGEIFCDNDCFCKSRGVKAKKAPGRDEA